MAKAQMPDLVRSDPAAINRDTKAAKIRKLLRKGWTSTEIANRLSNDPKRRKAIRTHVRQIIAKDEEYQAMQIASANAGVIEQWPEIMDAVARRGLRGRVDAAKYLGEVTGIHNPRVKHEHSGDINIRLLTLPRPERPQLEEPVVDATVVEED